MEVSVNKTDNLIQEVKQILQPILKPTNSGKHRSDTPSWKKYTAGMTTLMQKLFYPYEKPELQGKPGYGLQYLWITRFCDLLPATNLVKKLCSIWKVLWIQAARPHDLCGIVASLNFAIPDPAN